MAEPLPGWGAPVVGWAPARVLMDNTNSAQSVPIFDVGGRFDTVRRLLLLAGKQQVTPLCRDRPRTCR